MSYSEDHAKIFEYFPAPARRNTSHYLMNYFAEGLLEFTMNCGQFLGISVSFVNWNKDFVNLVDSFIHASLENGAHRRD